MHMCVDSHCNLSDHSGTKGLPYPYCYSWKVTQSASTTSASISTIALEPFPVTNKGQFDSYNLYQKNPYKIHIITFMDSFYKFSNLCLR